MKAKRILLSVVAVLMAVCMIPISSIASEREVRARFELVAGDGKATMTVYNDYSFEALLPDNKLDIKSLAVSLLLQGIESLGIDQAEFSGLFETGLDGVVDPAIFLNYLYGFEAATVKVTVDFDYSYLLKLRGDRNVITGTPESTDNAADVWNAFSEHLKVNKDKTKNSYFLLANGSYIKVGTEYLHFDKQYGDDLKLSSGYTFEKMLKMIREALVLETEQENQGNTATILLKAGTAVNVNDTVISLREDYMIELTFGQDVQSVLSGSLLEGFNNCESAGELIASLVSTVNMLAKAVQADGKFEASLHYIDLAKYSLALDLADDIAINFYVKNVLDSCTLDRFKVVYSFGGKEVTDSVASYDSNKFVVAKCAAKEMGDSVRIKVYYDDALIKDIDYSVRQYCESMLAKADLSAKDRKLFLAVLDYGAFSQRAFGYNYDNPVNANYSTGLVTSTVVPDKFKGEFDGKCTGIDKTKASLGLEYQTELMFYFVLADGNALDDFVFSKNGAKILPEEMANGTYRIKITGIAAKNLGEPYEVSVTNKTDMSCKTISFSPMSWAYAQQSSSDKSTSLLARALYLYYDASAGYFSAN